jgi:uncharacterized protein
LYPDDSPIRLERIVRPRPQPGFWWSILACVGLIVLELVISIPVTLGIWIAVCSSHGDGKQNFESDLNALQRLLQPTPAGERGSTEQCPPRLAVSLMVATAATFLGMFVYSWILIRKVFGRRWPRCVALRRPGLAQVMIAVILFLPGMMYAHAGIHSGLGWLFQKNPTETTKLMMSACNTTPIWLALFAVAVCPGIVEELFCRGFLGRGLVGRFGWPVGMLITSMLFGLLHLDPLYAAGTAVVGVFLHFTYYTSRSLWVPIVLHALNNSISVITSRYPEYQQLAFRPEQTALLNGSAFALVVFGGWALWSCRAKLVAVPGQAENWYPRYPGVELPPAGSGVEVRSGWPHPVPIVLALIALGGLVYSFWWKG